jgi:hypothetical protein
MGRRGDSDGRNATSLAPLVSVDKLLAGHLSHRCLYHLSHLNTTPYPTKCQALLLPYIIPHMHVVRSYDLIACSHLPFYYDNSCIPPRPQCSCAFFFESCRSTFFNPASWLSSRKSVLPPHRGVEIFFNVKTRCAERGVPACGGDSHALSRCPCMQGQRLQYVISQVAAMEGAW